MRHDRYIFVRIHSSIKNRVVAEADFLCSFMLKAIIVAVFIMSVLCPSSGAQAGSGVVVSESAQMQQNFGANHHSGHLGSSVEVGVRYVLHYTTKGEADMGVSKMIDSAIPLSVDPVDWSAISPDMVRDADLINPHPWAQGLSHSMAYYLGHFHRLANAVRTEDPYRGFIDLHVWRGGRDQARRLQRPYNARIMENILSLVWFYTKDDPWNPYYADTAVRQRLEMAMRFWISRQNIDGRFSEYGENQWNLAATAFAAKFMGEALVLLHAGPPLDADLYQQVRASVRTAIMHTLESRGFWGHGRRYTNQYTNVFAGALAYLHIYEDEEMEAALERRMRLALEEFSSPAGYMYEREGPDWSYFFGTHHSNVHMMWHYGRERPLIDGGGKETFGDIVRREYEDTTEWLAYNAVSQPDGKSFLLNRAIETRGRRASFERIETPLSEVVPLARAFSVTEEEQRQRLKRDRRQLEREWGSPPSLETGTHMGFSPYVFLHLDHAIWFPTEEQREQALSQLPYIAEERFVHQRMDDRRTQVFTYIRRPAYYAAFNGPVFTSPRGMGLLWHPEHGTLLQSHSSDNRFAWGMRMVNEGGIMEAEAINPLFEVDGAPVKPHAGARELPDGEFAIIYSMGDLERRISFKDDHIRIRTTIYDVEDAQGYVEQIPLLLSEDDKLEVNEEKSTVIMLRHGNELLTIEFSSFENVSVHEGERIQGLRQVSAHIATSGPANYDMRF